LRLVGSSTHCNMMHGKYNVKLTSISLNPSSTCLSVIQSGLRFNNDNDDDDDNNNNNNNNNTFIGTLTNRYSQ
jgi:hypothetical protein